MNLIFERCQIDGLLIVVPSCERRFVDEMAQFNFPIQRSLKLKEVMGYDRHRVVDGPVCVSDLAVCGLEYLFNHGELAPDDFDALILVTQSPDYFMPPTSNVIQGRLRLGRDVLCLDINQGCAGFLVGLVEAFLLLHQPAIRKVVLINGDVLSRKVSPHDRNSYPLIGDALSIAVVGRSSGDTGSIHANVRMDGTRRDALIIPAGGFREPSSPLTCIEHTDEEGNSRSRDDLVMDGSAVFNFVQTEVPMMVESLLETAGVAREVIDYYVFHQPNRFMLEKLADKLKIPHNKVPSNVVEHFGNSSGVTIPLALAYNLREQLMNGTSTIVLGGFGVGLTWSSMLLRLGPMAFCKMINYPAGVDCGSVP